MNKRLKYKTKEITGDISEITIEMIGRGFISITCLFLANRIIATDGISKLWSLIGILLLMWTMRPIIRVLCEEDGEENEKEKKKRRN